MDRASRQHLYLDAPGPSPPPKQYQKCADPSDGYGRPHGIFIMATHGWGQQLRPYFSHFKQPLLSPHASCPRYRFHMQHHAPKLRHPILLATAKPLDTGTRMHTTCCDRPCGGFGFVRTDHGSPKCGHCGHRPDDNSRAPFRSDHSSVPCGAHSVKCRSILRRRTRSVGFSRPGKFPPEWTVSLQALGGRSAARATYHC
jgi:hypothetical protein